MIVSREPAPTGGPVVGVGSVRAATPLSVSPSTVPAGQGDVWQGEPRDTELLVQLVHEREPSLMRLRRERDPMPNDKHMSDAIIEMLEARVRVIVGEWDGTLP